MLTVDHEGRTYRGDSPTDVRRAMRRDGVPTEVINRLMPPGNLAIYRGNHSPCEHFALAGYASIAGAVTDWTGYPDDEDDPSVQERQSLWYDRRVLESIRGPAPKKVREKKPRDEEVSERAVSLGGVRVDWHTAFRELKIWAGQATLESMILRRQAALYSAAVPPCRLIDWRLPIKTMSGLDPRTAAGAIDIGFSPAALDMDIETYVAAELLAIIGMQVSPITRFGGREYGYLDPIGQWWSFRVVEREGYHRMLTISQRRDYPTAQII